MKFGIRRPSLKKRISARTSPRRYLRHNLGLKARDYGWLTDPKRAAYNRVYNRAIFSLKGIFLLVALFLVGLAMCPENSDDLSRHYWDNKASLQSHVT